MSGELGLRVFERCPACGAFHDFFLARPADFAPGRAFAFVCPDTGEPSAVRAEPPFAWVEVPPAGTPPDRSPDLAGAARRPPAGCP